MILPFQPLIIQHKAFCSVFVKIRVDQMRNCVAEDVARLATDDKLMLKIAHDYMRLMGIENTQFIIARHIDRDHPHCHIVHNRVDNDGRTISDKNNRFRNEKVRKMLTARYRLHFSEGKKDVKFDRLRKHDLVKHYIYHVLRHEVLKAIKWSELRRALRRYKIDTEETEWSANITHNMSRMALQVPICVKYRNKEYKGTLYDYVWKPG